MNTANSPETRRGFAGVWFAMALCLAMLFPGLLLAQSDTGRVTGTVTDATGAVIPGATVTLVNTDTGSTQTATTNGEGFYNF